METIVLIIMLLVGNVEFNKGHTIELDMSEESENMVLTYQADGWVKVDIKEKNQPDKHYMSILIEEKTLSFKMQGQTHKMSKDEFLKTFEIKKKEKGKGFDFVMKLIKQSSDGKREEIRTETKMRIKKKVITVESADKTRTLTIKHHNKPDAGDGK